VKYQKSAFLSVLFPVLTFDFGLSKCCGVLKADAANGLSAYLLLLKRFAVPAVQLKLL
jgi:hypothetical protein